MLRISEVAVDESWPMHNPAADDKIRNPQVRELAPLSINPNLPRRKQRSHRQRGSVRNLGELESGLGFFSHGWTRIRPRTIAASWANEIPFLM